MEKIFVMESPARRAPPARLARAHASEGYRAGATIAGPSGLSHVRDQPCA